MWFNFHGGANVCYDDGTLVKIRYSSMIALHRLTMR